MSTNKERAARENIALIGATAMIVAINMAVGRPTMLNCNVPISAAKAPAMALMQTTTVRIAGTIPKRMNSICSQNSDLLSDFAEWVILATKDVALVISIG